MSIKREFDEAIIGIYQQSDMKYFTVTFFYKKDSALESYSVISENYEMKETAVESAKNEAFKLTDDITVEYFS